MPYMQQMSHVVQWFLGGKMQWSIIRSCIIKVRVICVKCNNVLPLQPLSTSIFELDYKKNSIFTHLYLQVLEEELNRKNESTCNNNFYNFLFSYSIQFFCMCNKLQTDSIWLGSHNIIIEKVTYLIQLI